MADVEYLVKSLTSWRSISDHLTQYQRHIDQNLKNVKLDLDEVSQEHTVLREIVSQLLIKQMTAPEKEWIDMSDTLLEKVHSIDTRLTRTETLVEQISIKLDKMDTKIDGLATKDHVELQVSKSETSMIKWIIGTTVIGIGLLSGIVFGIIKSVQP